MRNCIKGSQHQEGQEPPYESSKEDLISEYRDTTVARSALKSRKGTTVFQIS